jgi:hypothetical protein
VVFGDQLALIETKFIFSIWSKDGVREFKRKYVVVDYKQNIGFAFLFFSLKLLNFITMILLACFSEKVTVLKYKQNITFQGQGYTSTAIVWNDTAKSSNGTFYSGSVQVFSNNFIAKNISFMVRYVSSTALNHIVSLEDK